MSKCDVLLAVELCAFSLLQNTDWRAEEANWLITCTWAEAISAHFFKSPLSDFKFQVFYLSDTQNNTRSDWALKLKGTATRQTWPAIL